jgi:hypothetical protein
LTVYAKIAGRRGPELAPVEVDTPADCPTVRQLLGHIVRQQVSAFRRRQESRKFVRILTERQLGDAREAGKIAFGGDDLDQPVDPDQAVKAAVTAFEDQFYFVFVDNVQMENLDAAISIGPLTEVMFVRLAPLVGG